MLKVHTRKLGSVAVVCPQGRIVNGETASLRRAMDLQSNANIVVLDLARVSAVDASGLGLMLELRKQTEAHGAHFMLMNASTFVNHVLEVTHLDSVFEVTSGNEFRPALAGAVRCMPVAA